jgi:hypothetical protein
MSSYESPDSHNTAVEQERDSIFPAPAKEMTIEIQLQEHEMKKEKETTQELAETAKPEPRAGGSRPVAGNACTKTAGIADDGMGEEVKKDDAEEWMKGKPAHMFCTVEDVKRLMKEKAEGDAKAGTECGHMQAEEQKKEKKRGFWKNVTRRK